MRLSQGDRLGRYEILAPLGAGGMGEVYRARDTELEREVAVKVLPEAVAGDPKRLARFRREARAIARLSHPNILEIHDFGQEGEVTYTVTELLEGKTLRDVLARGPLPCRQALEFAASVADGLDAAHSRGVVHRDLKPENIFATDEGRLKILDFGLARIEGPGSSVGTTDTKAAAQTEDGAVVGTLGYMSPEQVCAGPTDHRTDIFALGVVLYEMLAGRPAFARDSDFATMSAIVDEPPPPLSESGVTVGPELTRTVERCLEKKPERRFQSAADLAFSLRAISDDEPAAATLLARLQRFRVRPRLWLVASAAVLLGVAALWFMARRMPLQTAADEQQVAGRGPLSGERPRVVVEQVENQTGDPTLDSLGVMVTDWVIQGLSDIATLDVVPDGAEGTERPRPGAVVTGTYYLHGDTLTFQTKVEDGEDGRVLLALKAVTSPRDRPVEAAEEVSRRVAAALASGLMPPAGWAGAGFLVTPPSNLEAYRQFIAGSELLGVDYPRAIDYLERASELDPDYRLARGWLAAAYLNLGKWHEADEIMQQLIRSSDRATQMERLLEGVCMAWLHGNYADELQIWRQIEKLDHVSWGVKYFTGLAAMCLNRPQEAVDAFKKGKSDVMSGLLRGVNQMWYWRNFTASHHLLSDYTLELEVVRQAREGFPDATYLGRDEVRALAALGRIDEVDRVVDECLTTPAVPISAGSVMLVAVEELRAHGQMEESRRLADRAVEWHRRRARAKGEAAGHRDGLGRALYLAERWDEAGEVFEDLSGEDPDNVDYRGFLGSLAVRRGHPGLAQSISNELANLDRKGLYGFHTYRLACIAALQGDSERAVQLLRDAFAQGHPFTVQVHREVDLESLWEYPPFQELIRPKG
jgi:tetratricopeptide (TPR) repeat protein